MDLRQVVRGVASQPLEALEGRCLLSSSFVVLVAPAHGPSAHSAVQAPARSFAVEPHAPVAELAANRRVPAGESAQASDAEGQADCAPPALTPAEFASHRQVEGEYRSAAPEPPQPRESEPAESDSSRNPPKAHAAPSGIRPYYIEDASASGDSSPTPAPAQPAVAPPSSDVAPRTIRPAQNDAAPSPAAVTTAAAPILPAAPRFIETTSPVGRAGDLFSAGPAVSARAGIVSGTPSVVPLTVANRTTPIFLAAAPQENLSFAAAGLFAPVWQVPMALGPSAESKQIAGPVAEIAVGALPRAATHLFYFARIDPAALLADAAANFADDVAALSAEGGVLSALSASGPWRAWAITATVAGLDLCILGWLYWTNRQPRNRAPAPVGDERSV